MVLKVLLFAVGYASAGALSDGVATLAQQCFYEPFPSSYNLLCSRDGAGIDFISTINHDSLHDGTTRNSSQRDTPHVEPRRSPWSHAPICTQHFDEIDSALCIYTSTSFAGGRGISILSTVESVDVLAMHPAFRGDLSTEELYAPSTKDRAWYTQPIPGKGIGMLAKRTIKRGELLAKHTPLLLVHPAIEQLMDVLDREKLLKMAVDQLPDQSKEQFLAMGTSINDPRIQIQDIIVTNSFQLYLSTGMHMVVVPEPARINHACNPNAIYHLSPDTLTHRVYAVRDIEEDEEITTTYSLPLVKSSLRRENLKAAFRFECNCPRCLGQGHFHDSDRRLDRIFAIQERLGDWSAKPAHAYGNDGLGAPRPELAEELVDLYKAEGLDAHIGTAYGLAALTYSSVMARQRAIEYAEKAMESLEMKEGAGGGVDGAALEEMRAKLKSDGKETHWSWGFRSDV